jgi:hypothetical protein
MPLNPNDRSEQLLAEILEVQRAHLEEYKRVTSQSLELQRQAVETQARHIRMYRRFVIAMAIVVVGLIAYAAWLGSLIQ